MFHVVLVTLNTIHALIAFEYLVCAHIMCKASSLTHVWSPLRLWYCRYNSWL